MRKLSSLLEGALVTGLLMSTTPATAEPMGPCPHGVQKYILSALSFILCDPDTEETDELPEFGRYLIEEVLKAHPSLEFSKFNDGYFVFDVLAFGKTEVVKIKTLESRYELELYSVKSADIIKFRFSGELADLASFLANFVSVSLTFVVEENSYRKITMFDDDFTYIIFRSKANGNYFDESLKAFVSNYGLEPMD